MLPYNPKLKHSARVLRRTMTDAERLLWSRVRGKQIGQVQFYRQKPVGGYIVDFYAPKAKLVIEVDGSQHREPENLAKDRKRDADLANLGLTVLRFNSREVMVETEAVMEKMYRVVVERAGM
jgi:very-short-patch-repair endonuclease